MTSVDVRGQGLATGWPLQGQLAYVDATVSSREPVLDPFDLAKNHYAVRSARVQLTDAGVNETIARALNGLGPVESARVAFKPGNLADVSARVRWHGLKLPVQARYELRRTDATTVQLVPRAFYGLPAAWARTLGVDLTRQVALPAGLKARVAADGTVTIDTRGSRLEAPLRTLTTGNGTLTATVGPAMPAEQRRRSDRWFALQTHGQLASNGGILRDAKVTCTPMAGERELPLQGWQEHGRATLDAGAVAIDPAALQDLIERADPLFKVDRLTLVGSTYQCSGVYNLGLKLPTRLDLSFTRGADGQLRLTPADARVCGLRMRGSSPKDDLAKLPFLKPDGDGFVVDLAAMAGLDLPRVGNPSNRAGLLELQP